MKKCNHTFRFFFLLVCLVTSIQSISAQLSSNAQISLITCRPGNEIYNAFGHTAIRVNDPARNLDVLFNYGMFSFNEPNFLPKFLRGKLMYWLGTENYNDFVNNYSNQQRSVFEQVLQIDASQKNRLFNALKENIKQENRRYLYDFFFDNCSTRPRDLIFSNLDSVEFQVDASHKPSFRELLDVYMHGRPWTDFGIDLIVGSIADRKATIMEQMFLPEYLMYHLAQTRQNEVLIAGNATLLVDYENKIKERNKAHFFSPELLFILVLLLELVMFIFPQKFGPRFLDVYDKSWWIILSLASLIILFMWFGTDHQATKWNLNILWMHPFYILLLKQKNNRLFIFLALLLIVSILQQFFFQSFHMASLLIILSIFVKLLRKIGPVGLQKA